MPIWQINIIHIHTDTINLGHPEYKLHKIPWKLVLGNLDKGIWNYLTWLSIVKKS